MLERVPDPDLDAWSGLDRGTDAHADDLALVLPALGERLEHGEAGGAHVAGLPSQDVGSRGFQAAVELVEPYVVVAERPALLLEVYPEDERKPAVEFAPDVQTDLGRRDFTINAMALELPGGGLVDPFGGLKLPELVEMTTGPIEFSARLTNVAFDKPVDDKRFEVPGGKDKSKGKEKTKESAREKSAPGDAMAK